MVCNRPSLRVRRVALTLTRVYVTLVPSYSFTLPSSCSLHLSELPFGGHMYEVYCSIVVCRVYVTDNSPHCHTQPNTSSVVTSFEYLQRTDQS